MKYYMETGSTDPAYNLAFEEYVLLHKTEGDFLLLWQNDNAVIIGRNQNTEEEIDRAFVEAHGVKVVRRITGGGAVYHDLGNLNYSFITDCGEFSHAAMAAFTEPVVGALRGLGLNAEASGRNDITVDGRKVSGTAQRVQGGRILFHGTLLFDSAPEMVAGALRADPAKFRSKSTKSVKSRVGNIRGFLPEKMSMEEFWGYLKKTLLQGDFEEIFLDKRELTAVYEIKTEKYDTWSWNFGHSPRFDRKLKKAFPGGILETGISVDRGGLISAVSFRGDFLSRREVGEIEAALTGCRYEKEAIRQVLESFPLAEYFGTITADEVLESLTE
ncbi:MAG: lipoate--protein ligase [Lachnospiraceae bacterium]|nr:lipoate--protein ligase [Lachnospiraceae bacterium]